jgi:type IV secretory pathway protease TraF
MGAALQYLAWNFDLWLGRIVAVLLASAAITVDTIAAGEARDRDSRGRPLPLWQGCKIIAAGEVFLMNWQSADSLDGRYFGVLPTSAIIGRAKPLWTSRKE